MSPVTRRSRAALDDTSEPELRVCAKAGEPNLEQFTVRPRGDDNQYLLAGR